MKMTTSKLPADMPALIAAVITRLDQQGTGSRRALADHLSIKPQNLSGWLTGHRTPDGPSTLALLHWLAGEF
jgi:DNA-binding transcriptional regulator YiaG